jgi:hypothetical protein
VSAGILVAFFPGRSDRCSDRCSDRALPVGATRRLPRLPRTAKGHRMPRIPLSSRCARHPASRGPCSRSSSPTACDPPVSPGSLAGARPLRRPDPGASLLAEAGEDDECRTVEIRHPFWVRARQRTDQRLPTIWRDTRSRMISFVPP